MFQSINPYNQSVFAEFPLLDDLTLAKKIEKASKAFKVWRETSYSQRSLLMANLAKVLRVHQESYAKTIALEMGKVLAEGRAEIEKCAMACTYYSTEAERFLRDEVIVTDANRSYVHYQPLGAVLAIMPWNFPFWQVIRFAAPSIMAGNVALLKHAPNVCQVSLALENAFVEAGFPEGVFQSLIVDVDQVEEIIAQPIVQAVTLTGSEFAGSQVAALAGKHIKKTVLELGGSDPFIVLEDADMAKAARIATQSRMQNAGQSCIAAKRFIVVEKVHEAFLHAFSENIKSLQQGDPLFESTTTGPLARIDLAEKLDRQLRASIDKGAKLLLGGERHGCNFTPALLYDVKPGMPAFDEETFGPLAAVITVKDAEEAMTMANNSRYGLGASIWTNDIERATMLSNKIESGSVFVNALVRSDVHLPFGGIKKSGYGRELSALGIKEFTNAKTVFITLP